MNTSPPLPERKKSKLWLILGVVFLVLVVVLGVGGILAAKYVTKSIAERKDRRAKFAEVEKQRRELLDAAKTSMEEGTVDGAAERLAKFGNSIGNAAESTTGAEKQALKVAQRMLQTMAPSVSAYEKAYNELQQADVLSVDKIASREVIASHVGVVKKFDEANEGLMQMVSGLEDRVRAELVKEGYPEKKREEFVVGFIRSANVDLTLKVRECDREFAQALQKILALLDREWGAWKAENGAISFDKPPVIDEYNGLIDKVDDIGTRQAAAQEELMNRTSKRAPIR